MTITVQQLIELARVRHHAFMNLKMPEGALVLFLNQKQRTLLLELGEEIEPLLGEAREVATVIAGALVGSDGGVPYYITTSGDGFPVQSDAGVPYVDFTGVPIALDPFGESGDTPGFPLPAEFVKLINVTAATLYNGALPVTILRESNRAATPQRSISVFVSGNRLVPIRLGVAPFRDVWTDVLSVSVSYVAMQTIASLSDVLTLPLQLIGVLEASLAERFAFSAEGLSATDKRLLIEERIRAEERFADAAGEILGEVTRGHVQFNG